MVLRFFETAALSCGTHQDPSFGPSAAQKHDPFPGLLNDANLPNRVYADIHRCPGALFSVSIKTARIPSPGDQGSARGGETERIIRSVYEDNLPISSNKAWYS